MTNANVYGRVHIKHFKCQFAEIIPSQVVTAQEPVPSTSGMKRKSTEDSDARLKKSATGKNRLYL